jgi:hypothetical protein
MREPPVESDVQLREFLQTRRAAIVDRWTDRTLQVYPPDAARRMRRERDRFQNPVGHLTRKSLEELFDGLVAGRPAGEMTAALDGIVRIRAVQDLSPSQAMGFVFLLKGAVRDELANEVRPDLAALDSGVDRLALEAFDHYARCREQIHQLRQNEIRRQTSGLMKSRSRAEARERDRART